MTQINSGSASRLSPGNGLRAWLFFLFCFFLLGYSPPMSILLGAVAGLATSLVAGWWKTKDDPSEAPIIPELQDEEVEDTPPTEKVSGLRSAHQRNSRARDRAKPVPNPFSRFFDKKNSDKKSP
jgi:hypothetical protein